MKKHNTQTVFRTLVCLALALLMLLSAVACKKDEPNENATNPPAGNNNTPNNPNDPQNPDDPYANFDPKTDIESREFNRDFTVLTAYDLGPWFDDEPGDQVGESMWERTLLFEEKYKTTLYQAGGSQDSLMTSLKASNMTGDKSFDLVFPHPASGMTSNMLAGYFANMREISTMTLDSPWYNQSQTQNYITTTGRLYVSTSDLTITGQAFFCLVYNRALYQNFGIEQDIPSLVKSGKWTAEAFNNILTQTDFDMNGEPTGEELYGFLCNTAPSHRWTYAFGETVLIKNKDGSFSEGLIRENMTNIAQAYSDILFTHKDAVKLDFYYNSGIASCAILPLFKSGHGLFINWDMGSCFSHIREIEFAKGYAPLPKLNDAQSDYRVICAAGLLAIPSVCTSVEESGLAYEFLSAYSYKYLRPAFFEVILGGRLSEYPEDFEMLNLIHEKKFFDFGYTLDEEEVFVDALRKAVVDNKNPGNIAWVLKGNANTMAKIIENANNMR